MDQRRKLVTFEECAVAAESALGFTQVANLKTLQIDFMNSFFWHAPYLGVVK